MFWFTVWPPNEISPFSGVRPHLTQCVIGPHKCICQMASKSVERFKHAVTNVTDRRQTDRPCYGEMCSNKQNTCTRVVPPKKIFLHFCSLSVNPWCCDTDSALSITYCCCEPLLHQHQQLPLLLLLQLLLILLLLLLLLQSRGAPIMLWPIIGRPIIGAK